MAQRAALSGRPGGPKSVPPARHAGSRPSGAGVWVASRDRRANTGRVGAVCLGRRIRLAATGQDRAVSCVAKEVPRDAQPRAHLRRRPRRRTHAGATWLARRGRRSGHILSDRPQRYPQPGAAVTRRGPQGARGRLPFAESPARLARRPALLQVATVSKHVGSCDREMRRVRSIRLEG